MSKARRHIHKYHKIDVSWHSGLWICALPECSHYWPPHLGSVEGKSSICWNCGDKFTLDTNNMQSNKPVCVNCNAELVTIADFIKTKELEKTGTK